MTSVDEKPMRHAPSLRAPPRFSQRPGARALRLVDLTGRERHLRAAMQAMAHVAHNFCRAARRALPFLVRRRARLLPDPVSIVETTGSAEAGPIYEVLLGADEGPAWGRLALNVNGLALILEGALGGQEGLAAATLGRELTLAQRALVGRIAKTLAEDFAQAIVAEVGLTLGIVSAYAVAAGESAESPGTDGLSVDCRFEGCQNDAAIVITVSAEALEAAAKENVEEEPSNGDPRMAEVLTDVLVELVVELGTVELGLRRLLALKPGQVLRMPAALDDPVVVKVAGVTKFRGAPVVSRGQLAVELRGRYDG